MQAINCNIARLVRAFVHFIPPLVYFTILLSCFCSICHCDPSPPYNMVVHIEIRASAFTSAVRVCICVCVRVRE